MRPNLSVITATWERPKFLALCLEQAIAQNLGSLMVEHIVVSDGPCQEAMIIASFYGAKYIERKETGGNYGAYAKDVGLEAATGDYVCFWDDDNRYDSHALTTLYSAAYGCDIGVVQTYHRVLSDDANNEIYKKIPSKWDKHFELENVDTMCVCIKRELACKEKWGAGITWATDYYWLKKLEAYNPEIRFVPITIGKHL